ncbi:MAG TPA: PfkB family carbohydrate kinase [Anaerolineae bacterium]|nr:PfkB family carbohydrate kinase [Anaerolineae bacterium]
MRYVAIGHICRDVAPAGALLGGSVTYASLTAVALGWEAVVITNAQPEVDLPSPRGIDWRRIPSERTTTFENIYSPAGRTQILHAWAGPIRSGDIQADWLRADVVHLAPIADEIDPALLDRLDGALVGATPQGWLRQWDAAGRVAPRDWDQAETILRRVDAVVLSLDDVAGDWARIEHWAGQARVLVATQGRDGCTVYAAGQRKQAPAPLTPVVDPTGAGDIFAAAFFTWLCASRDPMAAAQFANCLAARSVTRRGLAGVPTSHEVKDCREVTGTSEAPVT